MNEFYEGKVSSSRYCKCGTFPEKIEHFENFRSFKENRTNVLQRITSILQRFTSVHLSICEKILANKFETRFENFFKCRLRFK